MRVRSGELRTREIDVSMPPIGAHQLYLNSVTNIDALLPPHHHTLYVRSKGSRKGPVFGHAGHDGVEGFADTMAHRHSGDAFLHLAFHLALAIFHVRALR